LQEHHQRVEEGEEDEEQQAEKDDELPPARNSRKRSEGPIPTQIQFYPPVYKDLLEKAKKRSRIESLDNSFPHHETFLAEDAIEILAELHDQFAAEGCGVEEGYWDRYKHDMAIIVFCFFVGFCSLTQSTTVMGRFREHALRVQESSPPDCSNPVQASPRSQRA
jgi:hypothetical protein